MDAFTDDDGPNILDMTLKMNHDGEQSDARILRSDEFRRYFRLDLSEISGDRSDIG